MPKGKPNPNEWEFPPPSAESEIQGAYLYFKISAVRQTSQINFPPKEVLIDEISNRLRKWFGVNSIHRIIIGPWDDVIDGRKKHIKIIQFMPKEKITKRQKSRHTDRTFVFNQRQFDIEFLKSPFSKISYPIKPFIDKFPNQDVLAYKVKNSQITEIIGDELKNLKNNIVPDEKGNDSEDCDQEDYDGEDDESDEFEILNESFKNLGRDDSHELELQNKSLIDQIQKLTTKVQELEKSNTLLETKNKEMEVKVQQAISQKKEDDDNYEELLKKYTNSQNLVKTFSKQLHERGNVDFAENIEEEIPDRKKMKLKNYF